MYDPPVALESTATKIPLENLKARVVVPCSILILTGFVELASVKGLRNSTGYRFAKEKKGDVHPLSSPKRRAGGREGCAHSDAGGKGELVIGHAISKGRSALGQHLILIIKPIQSGRVQKIKLSHILTRALNKLNSYWIPQKKKKKKRISKRKRNSVSN